MTRPVSAASAAVFRIAFGVVGLVLVLRFFAHGWIEALFIDPDFHFKYPGFGWVQALAAPWMYGVFALIGVAAVAVALGYRHRVSAAVFALGLAYVELIDRTNYLNHYYWLVLTGLVLAFLPVNRAWSLDKASGRLGETGWVPVWVVWLLRFQVGMVYFFAGVAKLNPDWLFRAEPLATWLPARSDLFLIGPLLAAPITAFILSWAGAFFDLTVVFWLLIRPTRLPAFVALAVFHLTTWVLFPSIGVFPLVMTLSALVFFEPDWPDKLLSRQVSLAPATSRPARPGWMALSALYIVAMLVIPVRHFFIPGDVRWTGEGYQGSWQVMLTDKTGAVDFVITTEEGDTWVIGPPEYLTDRQRAVMATDLALISQVAAVIAERHEATVTAQTKVAVNGRPSEPYGEVVVAAG